MDTSGTGFLALFSLLAICICTVCVNCDPANSNPTADESRFAVCGLGAGRGFEKEEDDEVSLDTGRVVGGREAKQNEIVYIASVQSFGYNKFFHKCGGAIYSNTWIITASHCFGVGHVDNFDNYQIVAGEHELKLPEEGEQIIPVKRIVKHPKYNDDDNQSNDIALLELEKPLKFTKYVRPIKIPPCNYVPKGNGTLSGWGHAKEVEMNDRANSRGTDSLQVANVDIFSQKQCREILSKGFATRSKTQKFVLHENAFCAGHMDRTVDACQGDSGGPLACRDEDGDVLCGIVSYGFGCGLENFPGLYTYVPHFHDWIVHVTASK